jgi:hypothetical protein
MNDITAPMAKEFQSQVRLVLAGQWAVAITIYGCTSNNETIDADDLNVPNWIPQDFARLPSAYRQVMELRPELFALSGEVLPTKKPRARKKVVV